MTQKARLAKLDSFRVSSVMDFFDVGAAAAITMLIATGVIASAAIVFFVRSAPPTSITITSGPEGGTFQKTALKYKKILEDNGVKVNVLTSQGSSENLQRLKDGKMDVDVGMVQGGLANSTTDGIQNLVSLGSISHQPLLIFYRGKPMKYLSELKHKKIAIGAEGSGANQLSKAILAQNGIKDDEDGMDFITSDAATGAKQLQDHQIDAAFIMSESASVDILKALMRAKDIHLYSFSQTAAYVRKMNYLSPLSLPQGVIDLGGNIPSEDVSLVGPTIELIATKNLHPAHSDLLLEAATQIHANPGLFQARGEFPSGVENTIHISEDAARYYKSGKSFFYRYLPYWLASLLSRILVVFVPAIVLFIPIMKMILAVFQWRVKIRIRQRYRELLILEKSLRAEPDRERKIALKKNFDRIEETVRKMPIKSSYADQIYALRGHIDYVRALVEHERV